MFSIRSVPGLLRQSLSHRLRMGNFYHGFFEVHIAHGHFRSSVEISFQMMAMAHYLRECGSIHLDRRHGLIIQPDIPGKASPDRLRIKPARFYFNRSCASAELFQFFFAIFFFALRCKYFLGVRKLLVLNLVVEISIGQMPSRSFCSSSHNACGGGFLRRASSKHSSKHFLPEARLTIPATLQLQLNNTSIQ